MPDDRFPNQRARHTYKGGRRKLSAPDWTRFIKREDALEVVNASMFATVVGIPINAHVTINFSDDVPPDSIAKIVAITLKNFRQWLRRRQFTGADTTHIWVREHPAARHAHVHILLHVPGDPSLRITNKQFAKFLPRRALIDPATVRNNAQDHSGAPIIFKQKQGLSYVWGRYVLKGIARSDGEALTLTRIENQGMITGKRVGVAENIGKTERREWATHLAIWGVERALTNWKERASMPKRLQRPEVVQ